MVRLLLLLGITTFLLACPRTVEIEEPPIFSLDQDLGNFQLSDLAENFVPYETVSTLVFVDENEEEYNFRMAAPQYIETLEFQDVFPNPDNPAQNVFYRYSSNIQRFTFTSSELGAMFRMEVRSGLCGDPQLETDDVVFDYLRIRGLGFNSGDITVITPGFQLNIDQDNFCGTGQKVGPFEALGRSFEDVYTQSIDIGEDGFLQVLFNNEDGIVAFQTPEVFAVLDRKF